MSEGLKIAKEIYKRAKDQYNAPTDSYLGILMAVLVLSEPQNTDLWKRLAGYANSPEEITAAGKSRLSPQPPELLPDDYADK